MKFLYRSLPPLFLFLAVLVSLPGWAQTGSIRGFVYEKESGEPVLFTNVYLARTTIGAPTDANGYFAITRIPPGEYTLMVTYVGFDTLKNAGHYNTRRTHIEKTISVKIHNHAE